MSKKKKKNKLPLIDENIIELQEEELIPLKKIKNEFIIKKLNNPIYDIKDNWLNISFLETNQESIKELGGDKFSVSLDNIESLSLITSFDEILIEGEKMEYCNGKTVLIKFYPKKVFVDDVSFKIHFSNEKENIIFYKNLDKIIKDNKRGKINGI